MQSTAATLVTGGAGFIGSALVRALVADGRPVVNFDVLTYAANPENVADAARSPHYRFVKADITDRAAVDAALYSARPTTIFHLAAETHVDRSIDAPATFVMTNISGTAVLLEAATAYWESLDRESRLRFRFLQVSTDEVFGALGPTGRFNELSPYQPNSPYAASKAAADHLARAWHTSFGLPVTITNCGNNYGPYQFPEKLIPLMILNALEGKHLPIYGKGDQVRDWIHVDDHVAALRLVADHGNPGESYLVGASGERTNFVVVQAICDVLDRLMPRAGGHASLIREVEDRPGHDRRYALDASKISRELGWKPTRDFNEGIEDTVRWYLDNLDWVQSAANVYQRGRLGLRRLA